MVFCFVTFKTQERIATYMKNQLKTVALLGLLTFLAMWIGTLFGQGGVIIALVIVVAMNFGMYFFSDKLALKMYKAQPASKTDYPRLHALVEEVATKADIPKPEVYIINSATPNAFATGRNPQNGKVAFTTGIMSLLTERELKGVIAHEIAHIKNRDILITTIAATIGGLISYLATMAQWAAIFGGFGNRDGGPNILQLLVLIIVAPLLAMLIRMAISRAREYYADQEGASYINDPEALASALNKLEHGVQARPLRGAPEGGESLFIVNPFRADKMVNLFSTHPATEERVKRLRAQN